MTFNHNATKILLGFLLGIPLLTWIKHLDALWISLIQVIVYFLFYSCYDKVIEYYHLTKIR